MTSPPTVRPGANRAPAMLVGIVIGFTAALVLVGVSVLLNLDTLRNLVLIWFFFDQW